MSKSLVLILVMVLLASATLFAQETLRIDGLNEATYIYRTAEDSLNSYFRDAFQFNLSYRNFAFGMKYVAELPKYSTSQSELIDDINSTDLELGWKELYAQYQKDSFMIHAGTITETFGIGLGFRSWEDLEFDQDNRIDGFLMRYDAKLKLKAIYGAIPSNFDESKLDLAYGADAEYPLFSFLRLGGTGISYRSYNYTNPLSQRDVYDQRDVIGSRILFAIGDLELNAEYNMSELYYPNSGSKQEGSGIYATANYYLSPFQIGGAYKKYDHFNYRLHDLPLANHHGEPLADDQSSGVDEEGYQAYITWELTDALSLKADYAEAWTEDQNKKMNDLFAGFDWNFEGGLFALEYSHIEKIDDAESEWQLESTPALSTGFSVFGSGMTMKMEYKYKEKQHFDSITSHYEPKLQIEGSFNKLAISLGVQTRWEEPSELMEAVYAANIEAKYPLLENTDLTLFAGKDSGGKVCRNGICRYVAPFQGVKAELSTRF